jgi:hypothetical protein
LPMRRREPGFPVFRAEHEMVVQREMRRRHEGRVSDRAKDRNREFGPRAGGTREISRWCNHRTTSTKHESRPGRAREEHVEAGGQNIADGHAHASRAPAGALAVWGGSFPVVPGRSATFTTG